MSASEAGWLGGAAGGGNQRMEAWKGYVADEAAAVLGGESSRGALNWREKEEE